MRQRSKIAFVAHWDWVLFNFRLPLAVALRELGCDVVFVCPRGSYSDRLESAGFQCIHWQVNRRSLNPLREVVAISHLIRIHRQIKPDLVQNFTIKPNLYGTLSARVAGVPWIINTFTGLGYIFSRNEKARFLRYALLPAFRWAFKASQVFSLFQTLEDREILVRLGLVHREKTLVISGSGVDTKRFKPVQGPACLKEQEQELVVLMVARLLWDKGIAEFLEAARQLRSRDLGARFWIAGSTDQGNPASVPQQVLHRWNREGIAEFLGQREDVPGLLTQAQIAVLPSYHEGVPRFLVEAAASGLPLVASNVRGCREVVKNGFNGFLVPPRNAEALAGAIETLIREPTLRARMGTESRRTAEERFAERVVIGQHLELYRKLGISV